MRLCGRISATAKQLKLTAELQATGSMAAVTNVDFDKWGEYLTDGPLAMAFLDRLITTTEDAGR